MNVLISAGPTREYLDPVRFLSNRSTGKMGFALAEAAAERGHEVTLVAGPVTLDTPKNVKRIDVTSALEMLEVLQRELAKNEILIMSAAVADWRPRFCSPGKLKKSQMSGTLELEPNPDILKTLLPLKKNRCFVGFAAETGEPTAEAQRKRREKKLDMIVANDVSEPGAGFEVDTNLVTLFYSRNGRNRCEKLPLMSKKEVGHAILDRLALMFD